MQIGALYIGAFCFVLLLECFPNASSYLRARVSIYPLTPSWSLRTLKKSANVQIIAHKHKDETVYVGKIMKVLLTVQSKEQHWKDKKELLNFDWKALMWPHYFIWMSVSDGIGQFAHFLRQNDCDFVDISAISVVVSSNVFISAPCSRSAWPLLTSWVGENLAVYMASETCGNETWTIQRTK